MEQIEVMKEMQRIGYRVVPDYVLHKGMFEIIIEPWDWDKNVKRQGRTRRTGFFYQQKECFMNSINETPFSAKMKEIQMKLIEHMSTKKVLKK